MKPRPLLSERPRLVAGRAATALGRGRSALVELEGQLDDLLVRLRSPGSRLDSAVPDRLARARAEASAAMASLQALGPLFG